VIQALEPRFSLHSPQVDSRVEIKTLRSSFEVGYDSIISSGHASAPFNRAGQA
jgi:hypothetical protein